MSKSTLDPHREIWLSHSGLETYQKCPRYYYWKYIRKLEKIQLNIPYLIGNVWNEALRLLFRKEKGILGRVKKRYLEEKKKLMKLPLSMDDLRKLGEGVYVIQGMTSAYYEKYQTMLKQFKHMHHEKPFHYRGFDNAVIPGQMDNVLLEVKENDQYIHEAKSTKGLTPDYVRSIKTKIQTPMYFHCWNDMYPKKEDQFHGILYDVIEKPSIRQKKDEGYTTYLHRLADWYKDKSDAENKFHMERIFTPFLKKEPVMNTIRQILINIRERREKEDFEQNFERCLDGYECEMFGLCHQGEGKEVMIQYQPRPQYKVGQKK